MAETSIEWTDRVWNPVRGCAIVSKGCTNCYAMKQAHRFSGKGLAYEGLTKVTKGGPVWTGTTTLAYDAFDAPLRVKKPARWFVNSMSDLFHEDVAYSTIRGLFGVMAACPQHTFQILTKRAAVMHAFFKNFAMHSANTAPAVVLHESVKGLLGYSHPFRPAINEAQWPLPNVWLGVSVEDQAAADERIPLLQQCPAAVHFLSCEPLLGHIMIGEAASPYPGIGWVVAGGESGPGARPMHPNWARSLRDQCQSAGVPFLFKQWGAWASVSEVEGAGQHYRFEDGATVRRVGKKVAGRALDGVVWQEFPR